MGRLGGKVRHSRLVSNPYPILLITTNEVRKVGQTRKESKTIESPQGTQTATAPKNSLLLIVPKAKAAAIASKHRMPDARLNTPPQISHDRYMLWTWMC